ncbi:HAMP domain-containing protein [Nostoc sp. B(2019)]|nr:HAMP domain-containing protein [Nostoc sp. B(2019)]
MKISTKFIASSAVVTALIAVVVGGSTVLRNQADKSIHQKFEKSSRLIEVALQSEIDLTNEIIILKDYVLLKDRYLDIEKYQTKFIADLDELERLMPQAPELGAIRRRHQFLISLASELADPIQISSETYLADSQQDFRAINAFNRDIDFFLTKLINRARQQQLLAEQELAQLQRTSQMVSYAIVIFILLVPVGNFVLILLPVIRSLGKLQQGAEVIGAGNLDYCLNLQTGDEIEQLSHEFNRMVVKLAKSHSVLVERSSELSKLNQSLENEISDRERALREREQAQTELQQTLHELQSTQSQLIQTEKMSSLGQLVAGVAHEINNPVNFIYGNIAHASQYTQDLLELLHLYQVEFPNPGYEIQEKRQDMDLDFLLDDLPKILSSMKMGSVRIQQIVLSLRTFSRLDEADMKEVDIHEGIDSTLLILQNRLKAKPEHPQIELIKQYGQLPLVECYAGQLNQVFMNIINNAIDALESYNDQRSPEEIHTHSSQITICTQLSSDNRVVVRIADNGPGMAGEVQQKLFDPFFTTKAVGQGTGLGLSISYQIIVQKHSGVLRCESELGKGTEFWIDIPLRQGRKQEICKTELETVQA